MQVDRCVLRAHAKSAASTSCKCRALSSSSAQLGQIHPCRGITPPILELCKKNAKAIKVSRSRTFKLYRLPRPLRCVEHPESSSNNSGGNSSSDKSNGDPSSNAGTNGDTYSRSEGLDPGSLASSSTPTGLPQSFSIIESSETMKDFNRMDCKALTENINSRRNTVFLLMEEVRRLRIQLKVKEGEEKETEAEREDERYSSAIPFLPPIGTDTLKFYYLFYAFSVSALILFGGLLAPALELRLGLGGLSYLEFIESMHLPRQLALVDPIVASFVGGAVGVLSALLIVEVNNVTEREKEKCFYCEGSGYLGCGQCGGTGRIEGEACPTCSSTGKVMCTTCLCTGRIMATEHDPRIDPFM